MKRLLPLVLLVASLALAGEHNRTTGAGEPKKKESRAKVYTGPFQPCREDDDGLKEEIKSLEAYSIRDFLMKVEDGLFVPARADDKETFCASVLADDKGQPMGVVRRQHSLKDEEGSSRRIHTEVTGKILGKSGEHASYIYRAMVPVDREGNPLPEERKDKDVQWLRWPPCFAKATPDGRSHVLVQSGPGEDVELIHVTDAEVGAPRKTKEPHDSTPPKGVGPRCSCEDEK